MNLIRQEDIIHKFQLQRLLVAIVDNPIISQDIYFKGGTCAAMLGYLDRFSVDLDFDLKTKSDALKIRREFEKLFRDLNFKIDNNNDQTLFYILKYKALSKRNTLKLSVFEDFVKSNDYKAVKLVEIDRLVNCQTIESMFANKLVAPVDRFQKHHKIAGRDIYDIHYFFSRGFNFKNEIIEERMKIDVESYIKILIDFIKIEVTDKILTEDLNTLLPYDKFKKIRKKLKQETLLFLSNLI